MFRRRLTPVLGAVLCGILAAQAGLVAPAFADPDDGEVRVTPLPDGYELGARSPGSPGRVDTGQPVASGAGGGGGEASQCQEEPASMPNAGPAVSCPVPAPGNGGTGSGAPQVTPAELAQEAMARLPIPAPRVRTSPPRDVPGLVGAAQWFWVPASERRPVSQRVQAGDVWAEAVASPQRLIIHPGSGLPPVGCDDLGRPYDPDQPESAQRPSCSYTYQRSSAGQPPVEGTPDTYEVTVDVVWSGRWRGSGGSGGTLPSLTSSTTFGLQIAESQAITRE